MRHADLMKLIVVWFYKILRKGEGGFHCQEKKIQKRKERTERLPCVLTSVIQFGFKLDLNVFLVAYGLYSLMPF